MAGPSLIELAWMQTRQAERLTQLEEQWDDFRPDAVVERLNSVYDEVRWTKRFVIGSAVSVLIAVLITLIL